MKSSPSSPACPFNPDQRGFLGRTLQGPFPGNSMVFIVRALWTFSVALGLSGLLLAGAPVFQAPAANQMGVWNDVGSPGFSAGRVDRPTLAIDSNNVPYVAYRDAANSNKATVMKFDGSNWVTVGAAGFSPDQAHYASITIDDSDTPYVAFRDYANSSKATVMKFNGSNWVMVGSAGFTPGGASEISIAVHNANKIYVLYDYSGPGDEDLIGVMKFNGSGWVTAGSVGFTAGDAYDSSLAIDSSGTPYVAYIDDANDSKLSVMKFNGIKWVAVGAAGFSADYVGEYTDIAIDASGTPYVVYEDGADGDARKATVMKFNGSSWVTVGSPGFSAGEAHNPSIAIDSDGHPYVAYGDYAESEKLTVMKFDGSSWIVVDHAGFTEGYIFTPRIAIDSSNHAFVVCEDWGHDGYATVVKTIDGFQYEIAENTTAIGTIHANDPESDPVAYSIDAIVLEVDPDPDPFPFPDPDPPSVGDGDGAYLYLDRETGELKFVLAPDFDVPADANGDNLYEFTVTASANGADVSTKVRVAITNVPEGPIFQVHPLWQTVGSAGFSQKISSSPFLALDGQDTPYFVYRPMGQVSIAVVRYKNGDWEEIDMNAVSTRYSTESSITFDRADVPYVVYRDEMNSSVSVKKYDGGVWVAVGNEQFTAVTSGDYNYIHPAIALDGADTPYVIYSDKNNAGKATVMRFNGSSWETVGSAGFSAGATDYNRIAFDSHNTPYVVYSDGGNSQKTTVMTFDGSSWVTLGSAGFSADQVMYSISIVLDGNDIPYVAYNDRSDYSYKSTVMRYNGTRWVTVGERRFSLTDTGYTSLALDGDDIPYVVYAEKYPGSVTVMKYNGIGWDVVGAASFSGGHAANPTIAFDSNDNPYVGFWDHANAGKATVTRAASGALLYQALENTTAIGTINAIDPESEPVTYSISGFDSAYLSIDGTTGLLSFKTAPDFENPQDGDANNYYAFTVKISAGGDEVLRSGYVFVQDDPGDTIVEVRIPDAPIMVGNEFAFTITGAVGAVVVVEASTDLTNPVWVDVETLTLTDGTATFRDPDWTNYPNRFYRVRSQ